MKIEPVDLGLVKEIFEKIQPDLIDFRAEYLGCWIDKQLVGIVSWVELDNHIYLCHDHVLENFRGLGIYNLLHGARQEYLVKKNKPQIAYCNQTSLKAFLNQDFKIEKILFKVTK